MAGWMAGSAGSNGMNGRFCSNGGDGLLAGLRSGRTTGWMGWRKKQALGCPALAPLASLECLDKYETDCATCPAGDTTPNSLHTRYFSLPGFTYVPAELNQRVIYVAAYTLSFGRAKE